MAEIERPGVMLYFDVRPALDRLSDAEAGQLFRAILDFSQFGVLPELAPLPGAVFDLIRPRLERDAAHYTEIVLKKQYAVYCREMQKQGAEPDSFDVWKASRDIR